MQIDIFTAPFRLYNAMLHNNALNIGLDMSKVKLPIYNQVMDSNAIIEDSTRLSYSSSSILTYLGQRTIRNYSGNKKTIALLRFFCFLFLFIASIYATFHSTTVIRNLF